MAESLGIALLGCGTVGTGVAKILLQQSERLLERSGRQIELRHILVRHPDKLRDSIIPTGLITTDWKSILQDSQTQVVCELIGGTHQAQIFVKEALQAGKHIVTANKALLAEAAPELFDIARKVERCICFEAAVAGGVPIIRALAESLSANQIISIQAILNGTSNFILTAMTERGISYAEALSEAQKKGFAEADPTLDVDGSDAAHKLAILAQLAFGVTAQAHEIEKKGIEAVDATDIHYGNELGYSIKLLAEAWVDQNRVALHVAPVMVRKSDMLAQVRGAYNAIQLIGDIVGETLYQGPGAGMMATASSVVGDIIDLAVGRSQKTFQAAQLWSNRNRGYTIEPSEKVRSRFYLRLKVTDRAGALSDVCQALADESISISSLIQHEAPEEHENQPVTLVIMTHYAETGKFRNAMNVIRSKDSVLEEPISYSVDD